MSKKIPVRALKVDAEQNEWDKTVLRFGAGGMSTAFIIRAAKERSGIELSQSQVTYRLKQFGIVKATGASRMDFRNGTSPFCRRVIAALETRDFDKDLFKFLRANLPPAAA